MDGILKEERLKWIRQTLKDKGTFELSGVSFKKFRDGIPSHEGIFKDLSDIGYVFTVSKTDSPYKAIVNYSLGGSQNA